MNINKRVLSFLIIPLPVLLLLTACGDPPAPVSKERRTKTTSQNLQQKEEPPRFPPPEQQKEPVERKEIPVETASPDPYIEETTQDNGFVVVDWGREISLDEIMTMAKSGRIRKIEWHVMPNIIRFLTVDDKIFHLRNENKGIDIRSKMTDAGLKVGKGGIDLQHVF